MVNFISALCYLSVNRHFLIDKETAFDILKMSSLTTRGGLKYESGGFERKKLFGD